VVSASHRNTWYSIDAVYADGSVVVMDTVSNFVRNVSAEFVQTIEYIFSGGVKLDCRDWKNVFHSDTVSVVILFFSDGPRAF